MAMREKLIELIGEVQGCGTKVTYGEDSQFISLTENEELADHLMANGVTLQQTPRFFISYSHKKDIADLNLNAPILVRPDTMTITPIGNRWIPVKERLPENYATVLAYDGSSVEPSLYFSKRGFWTYDQHESDYISGVTHWMPLPDPPKGE